MKCQGLLFPNGILGSIILNLVAQNGKGIIHISGVKEKLETLSKTFHLVTRLLHGLYADDIYDLCTVILKTGSGKNNY